MATNSPPNPQSLWPYIPLLADAFIRCGTRGKGICLVILAHGEPNADSSEVKIGCSRYWGLQPRLLPESGRYRFVKYLIKQGILHEDDGSYVLRLADLQAAPSCLEQPSPERSLEIAEERRLRAARWASEEDATKQKKADHDRRVAEHWAGEVAKAKAKAVAEERARVASLKRPAGHAPPTPPPPRRYAPENVFVPDRRRP